MMSDDALVSMFERLLVDIASPEQIRAIEQSGSIEPFWEPIEQSGYLNLLLPEDGGGAGVSVAEAETLIRMLGAAVVPAPVAETMVARFLLWTAGIEAPDGPIILIAAVPYGAALIARAPFGHVARHALVDLGDKRILTRLTPDDGLAIEPDGLTATITWSGEPAGTTVPRSGRDLQDWAAALRAAEISGLAARVVEMTVTYAGERVQFGKPIGRQQALQQYLAMMAEQAVAARIAAQIGLAGARSTDVATAKYVASKAASFIADTAHALFGAIGMSKEHDLQLYTGRLREWRLANGSETFWARQLGAVVLAQAPRSLIEFAAR